jgi:predicted RNA-binding Zn-ribbon protein involved in translation (DUF1610 family)
MRYVNREVERLQEAKCAVLVACRRVEAGGLVVGQRDYRLITAGMAIDDKTAMVHWFGTAGIDVLVPTERLALYHAAPGRQYRPSKRERESGRYECPACHIILVRVTRKAKDPLYRCQDCGWSIARSDIFDPEPGETPELRDDVEYPEGVVPASEEPQPW